MTSNKSKNVTFFVGSEDQPSPLFKFKARVEKGAKVSYNVLALKNHRSQVTVFKDKLIIQSCEVAIEPHKIQVDWRAD